MSIPLLASGEATCTLEDLHAVSQANNFAIEPGSANQEAYLLFANAFDAICQQVNSLPEYFDPRLQPVETVGGRQYERPGKEDNPLNAWMYKSHLISADPSAAKGPLAGKTIVLKDNISLAGFPLGLGCDPSILKDGKHPISPIDATIVKRILAAGGIIKGTATCENLSLFPLSFTSHAGNVHNAWLPTHATGGSSSGCASLVSVAGVEHARKTGILAKTWPLGEGVDMAIGGDQGGSIRLPSAYSGIYGLKPTHGLVPYTGIAGLLPMIDHTGPMCQSIDDCALLMSVIAGYDGLDIRMTPESPLRSAVPDYLGQINAWIGEREKQNEWHDRPAAGMRVAILTEAFDMPAISAEVVNTVRTAARRFEKLGASVSNVSIPFHKEGAALWTTAPRPLLPHFLSNRAPDLLGFPMPHLEPLPVDQNFFDVLANRNPATVNALMNATHMDTKYGPQLARKAMMHVHELRAAYDQALQHFDVLITPCNATVGPRLPPSSLSSQENPKGISPQVMEIMKPAISSTLNTSPFNLTGHPAMSIPVGRGKVEGGDDLLPIGMQLIAKRFDEMSIFKAAKAWEQGGSWLES